MEPLLLERDAWIKALLGEPEEIPGLRKGFGDVIKAIDAATRTIDTVITTGAIDRDHDVINPKKWNLKHYKKNPVVQWAHDHDMPVIAQSVVSVGDGKLLSKDTFPAEEVHPFANMIFNLVSGKFIRAKSVGFRPERGKFAWDEEQGGYRFEGQELLEHSYVNVPSNPEALVGAKAAGIDIAPLIEWAKAVLDADDNTLLWLPRETVERALQIAENERSVIQLDGLKLNPATPELPAVLHIPVELERKDISVDDIELDAGTKDAIAALVNGSFAESNEGKQAPRRFSSRVMEMLESDSYAEVTTQEIDCPSCDEKHEVEVLEYPTPLPIAMNGDDGEKITEGISHWTVCQASGRPMLKFADALTDTWMVLQPYKQEEESEKEPDAAQLLTALLDTTEPAEKKDDETVTDAEVEFLGKALGEAIGGQVQESVKQCLTSLTGKLD